MERVRVRVSIELLKWIAHLKDFEGKKSLVIRDLNIGIFTVKLKVKIK